MSTLLDVTPNEAAVSVKGGITKHRLHCVGKQRLAFKVMVSTKRFMSYSFKPVMGFITPGEFRDVIIKHVPGTRKSKDTISIAYIPAPTGNDAHQIFDEAEEKRRVKIKVHVVDPEPEELNETDYRAHFDEPGVLWNKETLDDKGEDNDKDVQELSDKSDESKEAGKMRGEKEERERREKEEKEREEEDMEEREIKEREEKMRDNEEEEGKKRKGREREERKRNEEKKEEREEEKEKKKREKERKREREKRKEAAVLLGVVSKEKEGKERKKREERRREREREEESRGREERKERREKEEKKRKERKREEDECKKEKEQKEEEEEEMKEKGRKEKEKKERKKEEERRKAKEKAKREAKEEVKRRRAEEEAKRMAKEEEERRQAEEEAKRMAKEEEERRQAEEEAKRKAEEEEERRQAEEEAKRKAEEEEERIRAKKEAMGKAKEEEENRQAMEKAKGAAAEAAAVADAAAAGPRVVPALTIDPPAASFPNGVGTSVHQLTNPSRVRVAFKIKSSNNRQYYLNPVFGFIEPNASAPLEVNRVAGPAGTDKLVVLFKEAPADAKDAYAIFKEGLELGKIIIPLMAGNVTNRCFVGTVAGAGASDGVQSVADPVQDGGLAAARNAAPLAAVQSEAGRAAQGGGAGITANAPVPAGEPQRKN